MILLHPFMLAWIAGAVIPLLVHLLSRSQYRAVPWGAMMFLTGTEAGPQAWTRIRRWLLLILRMGAVGLLAVALARPVIAARYAWVPSAGLITGGPAAVVIILDDSASMGYQRDGSTRLDSGRQVVLQILSSLKRGDEAALLLVGARDYQPPVPPNADLQSIAGRVMDLQPDAGQADFAVDLTRAADVLARASNADREIFLICDHQAGSWRNVNDEFKRRWTARRSAGPLPRVTVIPVGGDEADNVALEAVDFPDHSAIRDQPGFAQVRIRNYGPAAVDSVPLTVWTAARTVHETTVSVPARSVRSLSVPIRFGEAGSRVVSAAVRSTGLTSDDRLDVAVDVLDTPELLVVAGQNNSTTRPDDDLAAAIYSPNRNAHSGAAFSTTIFTSDLNPLMLSKANVLILTDAGTLSPQQLLWLKAYVNAGGGVLILADEEDRVADTNQVVGQAGLLRARIQGVSARPARLANLDAQHPVFRFLPDRLRAALFSPVYRHWTVSSIASDTHVIARYTTGEPAILEKSGQRGRVILLTALLERRSLTTAPVQALLQSIIRYLAAAAAVDRNIAPGQPIIAATTQPVDDRSSSVQFLSTGTREPAAITHPRDGTDEVRYTNTSRPGTYRLRYRSGGKETVLNFVATAGHGDSDLTALTSEQWDTLSSRIPFDKVDLSHTTVAQAIAIQRGGREIWIDVLAGVLLLMVMETVLSRWWSTAASP